MNKAEVIKVMQEHIESYKYQLSDAGWKEMIRKGIFRPGIRERLDFGKFAHEQIEAYEMAIEALKGYGEE